MAILTNNQRMEENNKKRTERSREDRPGGAVRSCARGTVRVIPDPRQCRPRGNPPTAGRISKMKNFKDEKYPSGS